MMVTEDGGKTFRKVGESSKHVDNHAFWINPKDTENLLVGCDGGIYESFDGAKIVELSQQIYRLLSFIELQSTTINLFTMYMAELKTTIRLVVLHEMLAIMESQIAIGLSQLREMVLNLRLIPKIQTSFIQNLNMVE